MERIFHPYEQWEDKKAGMYNHIALPNNDKMIRECIYLFKNDILFYQIMKIISTEWKLSAETNLSHVNNNRRAWLGRAACCYYAEAPENITQRVWTILTKKERENANKTADRFLVDWEKQFSNQYELFEVTHA